MEKSESSISFNSTKRPSSAFSISTSEFKNFPYKESSVQSDSQLEEEDSINASSWGSSSKHSYYSIKRKYGELMVSNNSAFFGDDPEISDRKEMSQIDSDSEDSGSDQTNIIISLNKDSKNYSLSIYKNNSNEFAISKVKFDEVNKILKVFNKYNPYKILVNSMFRDFALLLKNQSVLLLPSSDFSLNQTLSGLDKLENLSTDRLENLANFLSEESIKIYGLSMMNCMSSIINYILIKNAGNESWGIGNSPIKVNEYLSDNLGKFMNYEYFKDMPIFNTEPHQNLNNIEKNKDSNSLFELFNLTTTSIGKKLLKAWMKNPLTDKESINLRHNAIKFIINPENIVILDKIHKILVGIGAIERTLGLIFTRSDITDWIVIKEFIAKYTDLKYILGTRCNFFELHNLYNMNIFETLKGSLAKIEKMIDFDSSIENGKIIIKDGIDEVLDQLKSIYNQLDQILNEEAINFKNISSFKLQSINIVYYPQLGHLICTPISQKLLQNGYQIPELEFIFCSSKVCYYKNSRMRFLDEEYGDVYNLISDREIELYETFKTEFKNVYSDIKKAISITAELDCILSLAKAATKYNLVCPNLINKRRIIIKNGRNLLVENFIKCIENDCIWDYTDNKGQVSILKGPNASGKSVYLQSIATIVYLCQIGSFVPAQSAELPVIDQLFTIFTTDESIAQELSTFYQDLTRGFNILEKSTQNSLAVIDEFGKGTNISDGIGLLCALIIELLNKGENCPFTILTTHFHEIKKYFNEEQLQGIHWLRTKADIYQKNMKYYFKVVEGSESQSWGIRFAEEYGLDKSIIARAKYFQNKVQNMELPIPEISQELNKKLGLNRQVVDTFFNTEFNENNFELFKDYINKLYN